MKILLVQTGFIGDVVLSTPVISNLRKIYPTAEIMVLTTPATTELFRYHPEVHSVLAYDKRGVDSGWRGLVNLSARLRDERFDMAFSLHKSFRTALLLWKAGIPERLGFQEASAHFLYTKTATRRGLSHEVERNLSIFCALGKTISELDQRLVIGVPPEVQLKVDELLAGIETKTAVGIAPGSVWLTKRWTDDGFREFTRHLHSNRQPVIIIGGKDDGAVGSLIEHECRGNVLNLVGKTSLLEAVEVIRRLKLLVTNDSAPLHFASATDTPVVALFCATSPALGYGPWQIAAKCVGLTNLYCRPCGRHGGNSCPTGTHACRIGISSQMVIEATEQVLLRTGSGEHAKNYAA